MSDTEEEEESYSQRYYRENKDKLLCYNREYLKTYYHENKERFKGYYQQNKKQRLDYQKAYQSKSAEKIREYQKKYWLERKKKIKMRKSNLFTQEDIPKIAISNKPVTVTFD